MQIENKKMYTSICKDFNEGFFELVENSENIVITSHFSPDGDSISSVLSVYSIISAKFPNKNIKIIYSGKTDTKFSYFKNFEKIIWAEDVSDELKETDLVVLLDAGLYSRSTQYPEKLQGIKNQICIDHHASGSEIFSLSIILPEIPSCSELIFRLFENDIKLDKDLAEIFLLGILTDTGSFSFLNSSQSETFVVAKKLLEVSDTSIDFLKSKYNTMSKREFNLIQEFIKNTSFTEIENWPPAQHSYVSRECIEKDNYSDNEISAASSMYIGMYVRSIKDYTWGFVIKPKDANCTVSMRALPGSVNVRDMLERMSLGGGHDRAGGGILKNEDDPKECISKIIKWMKNNKPILN